MPLRYNDNGSSPVSILFPRRTHRLLTINECGMASMLEYVKTILQKVSFDRQLFEKELRKALQELVEDEVKQLKAWCYAQFGRMYRVVLNRCFRRTRLA